MHYALRYLAKPEGHRRYGIIPGRGSGTLFDCGGMIPVVPRVRAYGFTNLPLVRPYDGQTLRDRHR